MNCPYCDNEIVSEDVIFCPKCGKSLAAEGEQQEIVGVQQKQTDLVLAAAMLTIISAAFIASVGYIGIYQYAKLVDYFGSYLSSEFDGFLVFGAVAIIASALGMVGGLFMLKRKHLKISILGVISILFSVFVTYLTTPKYYYSYDVTAILLFSEVTIFIFSILSGVLLATSSTEFS